ncbi:hypothetical protein ABZN20_11410 [Methylococcus sp. ANG]|jgi:hypothetical protein|uniref:hypothetical protein n=1 Tax=unclassified Methylococcus TaxID=2618889 RepID=UPI001C5318CC|nr:hypothetical protein [Methylococcus sp. Mc7]QXP85634.1 hypothetical protein KW115_07990 [Methylococcus sp. Mc7]
MSTKPVASTDWVGFCEEFSRQHRGWLVTTSIRDKPLAAENNVADAAEERCVVRDVRFRGLSFEPKDGSLSVSLGEGALQITQSIAEVAAIGLLEAGQGVHAGLRIDSAGHGAMILRFRAPASPDSLDGPFAPWL